MQLSDFHFDLPAELIAQEPLPKRSSSRLLVLHGASGNLRDLHFRDLPSVLNTGDLLVFNNTRVLRARLFGHKSTGGHVEVLLERIILPKKAVAQIRANKPLAIDARVHISENESLRIAERHQDMFIIESEHSDFTTLMSDYGHVPIPPYIRRPDNEADTERYQTIYAKKDGSVAAPTAGLHFDEEVLDHVKARGVQCCEITLHVGAGTFLPVKTDDVTEHKMHAEYVEILQPVCEKIRQTRRRGGRVIAIGTTTVRALESAAASAASVDQFCPFKGETTLFILPGYNFRVVDAMLTNFHLPGSTLLMLVSAFASRRKILDAYKHAVQNRYRFFSYGDAMFITRLDIP